MRFRFFFPPPPPKTKAAIAGLVFSLRMAPEQAGTVLQDLMYSILRTGMNGLRSDAHSLFALHFHGSSFRSRPIPLALLGLFTYCSDEFHGNGRGLCRVDML